MATSSITRLKEGNNNKNITKFESNTTISLLHYSTMSSDHTHNNVLDPKNVLAIKYVRILF